MLAQDLQKVSKQLLIEFERTADRAKTPLEVGTGREEIVRRFLADYLPSKWSVGSGFIVDSFGKKTAQMDIVVNDDLIIKPLSYAQDRGLYFAESVGIVVQVKSTLNKQTLRDAIKNLDTVKKLRRAHLKGAYRIMGSSEEKVWDVIPTLLFAFQSDISLPTIAKSFCDLNKELEIEDTNQVDAVFILNKGVLLNIKEGETRFGVLKDDGSAIRGPVAIESREDTLFDFLLFNLKVLPTFVSAPVGTLLLKYSTDIYSENKPEGWTGKSAKIYLP